MTSPTPRTLPAGYGLRPRAARARAAEVRAARHPSGRRIQRPVVLLVIGGALGIWGWAMVSYMTASGIWTYGSWPGPYGLGMTVGIGAYLVGVMVFSWGWELGVAGRAIRVAIFLAIAGIVAWLVIAVVAFILVAMLKSDGGGGGGGGGSSGASGASGSGGGEGLIPGLGRTVVNAMDSFAAGGGSLPDEPGPAAIAACSRCGYAVDPNTMRMCPSCSQPL